ncbi:MAG: hypothetical protein V1729_05695 [Candidatus Woesearchaeota archaeon]
MVELKFNVKKQNIRVFNDILSEEDCERKVKLNREKAFGVLSNMKSMFDKKSTISITHKEKKYYPFWQVKAESLIEYKRQNRYQFSVDPQVRNIRIASKIFEISKEAPVCIIDGEDHCIEHYTQDVLRDATDMATKDKKLAFYMKHESRPIRQTEDIMGRNRVVFPATVRGASIVRELFKDLIKPVQADKILTERIEVTEMCLYFRSAWAYELTKHPSGKTAALEIDALTGEIIKSSVIKKELKELMPENVLFEVGTEFASMVIPGAAAAAIIGRQLHERSKKKNLIKQMKSSQNAMTSHGSSSPKKKGGRLMLRGS